MTAIAYDLTRLFLGPLSRTPRGIDRIDLLLAWHFFSTAPGETLGVLPTPWGIRVFGGEVVLAGLQRLQTLWGEDREPGNDPVYLWAVNKLQGRDTGAPPPPPSLSRFQQAGRIASLLRATGIRPGSPVRRIPGGAVYVNVGQISLAAEFLFSWLKRRPDIRPILMLHDVIPLDMPHLVSPSSARHHRQMVGTTARYASGVLVSTEYARQTVCRALALHGWSDPPVLAAHLPLISAFDAPAEEDTRLASVDYFVTCGAIEPRKNLGLLLTVWQRLVTERGAAAPQLVVIGSPTAMGHGIFHDLVSAPETARHIHVVSGLSTAGVKALMGGARGLLMPSHAEGYGLPVAEAGALGCSVIASDIPAHREIANGRALLIDPGDVENWHQAIRDFHPVDARAAPPGETARKRRDYLERISAFVATCPPRKTANAAGAQIIEIALEKAKV